LDPLAVDRLRQDRGRRRAVAGDVGRLGCDLADHLGAHVLERVLELDLLGDGDAVLGDRRGAELLLDDDVAALGAEGHLDRVGELVDAAEDGGARVARVYDLLVHVSYVSWSNSLGGAFRKSSGSGQATTARISSSR